MAEQVQRGLDREGIRLDAEEVVRRCKLPVELAAALDVAGQRRTHLRGDLRADDVRVDADPTGPAELHERLHESIVTRIQVEPGVDNVLGLPEVAVGLLDGSDGLDLDET